MGDCLVELDSEDDDDDLEMADYLDELFDSDSEDMDIEEMCQLDLGGCSKTVQTMIDELSDVNFQETYASKLAFNCRNQQNREAIMAHKQKLFDTIIESIMCNITFAYLISKQLARCPPGAISQQAQEDLCMLQSE